MLYTRVITILRFRTWTVESAELKIAHIQVNTPLSVTS